jgi:hypothetical protein
MSDPSIDPAATSAGAATALAAGEWTLDPDNSRAEFAVKHFWGLVTVRGLRRSMTGAAGVTRLRVGLTGSMTLLSSRLLRLLRCSAGA